jgi:hypothetical protein
MRYEEVKHMAKRAGARGQGQQPRSTTKRTVDTKSTKPSFPTTKGKGSGESNPYTRPAGIPENK